MFDIMCSSTFDEPSDVQFKHSVNTLIYVVGVKMVANIGPQKCKMKPCILGALASAPWLIFADQPSIITTALFSAAAATYYKEWDPEKRPPKGGCNCVKRAMLFSFCAMMYLLVWGSVLLFNVKVTSADGTQVPFDEAFENFLHSAVWKDIKASIFEVYDDCFENGVDHCFMKMLEKLDPTGELHAYAVSNAGERLFDLL